eukprot:scaffold14442_cov46-Attheya_sp.AAC.2
MFVGARFSLWPRPVLENLAPRPSPEYEFDFFPSRRSLSRQDIDWRIWGGVQGHSAQFGRYDCHQAHSLLCGLNAGVTGALQCHSGNILVEGVAPSECC